MKQVVYGLIAEDYRLGGERRISYGIAAYADAGEEKSAVVLRSVHDITGDGRALERLVRTCNRLRLSPCHLADIVEDFLAQ